MDEEERCPKQKPVSGHPDVVCKLGSQRVRSQISYPNGELKEQVGAAEPKATSKEEECLYCKT
jgi:hypothetical protein